MVARDLRWPEMAVKMGARNDIKMIFTTMKYKMSVKLKMVFKMSITYHTSYAES